MRKFEHVSPFIKELGWLKIKEKYKYNVCTFVFKALRNYIPDWLYNFTTAHSEHGLNTRHSSNLAIRRVNLELGSREMNGRGPTYWNEIPVCIQNSITLPSFKEKLRNYMLMRTR